MLCVCAVSCVHRSTLVVDDLEEARSLCYGCDRHKVVSVDGTMFKPNGTFTGAMTRPPGLCAAVTGRAVLVLDLPLLVCTAVSGQAGSRRQRQAC